MIQKNNIKYIILALILISQISLVACSDKSYSLYVKNELNKELKIDGIEFLMNISELEEILGESYDMSPCVYGHELIFEDMNLTIGIDKDKMLRKVIIKDSNFSIFSINTDNTKSQAIDNLIENGFSRENSHMYINDFVSIKLLSDGEDIRGIILEKNES